MVDGMSVNILKTDSEKLTCSFNSTTGVAENVQPVSTGETWTFKSNITGINYGIAYNVNFYYFDSNAEKHTASQIRGKMTGKPPVYRLMYYDDLNVYMDYWVVSNNFRTIYLEQPATGDLLTYLQANATKIS